MSSNLTLTLNLKQKYLTVENVTTTVGKEINFTFQMCAVFLAPDKIPLTKYMFYAEVKGVSSYKVPTKADVTFKVI